jgi:guanylate kinase
LFVLSSPSGGGKTTVARHVVARLPRLHRSVSVTTRRPRSGERSGRDYTFVSAQRFARGQRRGAYLESANGTPRHGRRCAGACARATM